MQIKIKQITSDHVGQTITLQWWIQTIRSSGKLCFIELRDGSGYIQCVSEINSLGEDKFKPLEGCGIETSLSITWTISKHPKKEEFELQVSDYHIFWLSENYPLGTKDDHGPEFLFDNRHLYLRSKSQVAIQKVRDTIIHATYDRMRDHDFTKIDAPIFTPNACEGTTELYSVEHVNGEIMYLSQSGQLYIEAAMFGVGRCYDFGPTFRAENCKTRRHMNEFWMMDAEIPFIQQEENMQIQEQLVFYILQQVLEHNMQDLILCGANIEALQKITFPFRRITHAEWCIELESMGFEVPEDKDVGSDLEMQYCQQKDQPVFITNFPIPQKAFYFKEDPNLPGTVLGADLLAPGDCGEIIGGGTRIDDYDLLLERIKEHGLDPEVFDWYLDLRKYGSVPHAGFGYGLERIVRWICGIHHIRETIPFPRYNNRIRP
jgi:asparaginyl-tRNA synthetase